MWKWTPAMHGDFNACAALVAINDGDQGRSRSVWRWWHWKSCRWPATTAESSRPRCTAKLLHCKGQLTKSLAVMQQTEQMARRHDVMALRPVEHHSAKRNPVRAKVPAGRLESQEKRFQLVREQHLEQLPMHEFLLRIRSQLLWGMGRGWMKWKPPRNGA